MIQFATRMVELDAKIRVDFEWSSAFDIIRDAVNSGRQGEVFAEGLDIMTEYPRLDDMTSVNFLELFRNRANRASRFAYLLWHLKEAIDVYDPQLDEAEDDKTSDVLTKFAALMDIPFKSRGLYRVSVKDVPLPNLRPNSQFEEDFMEPYNRLFHALSFLFLACSRFF